MTPLQLVAVGAKYFIKVKNWTLNTEHQYNTVLTQPTQQSSVIKNFAAAEIFVWSSVTTKIATDLVTCYPSLEHLKSCDAVMI